METRVLPKGVYKNGRKFFSQISHEKQNYYLGTFKTAEEAQEAYDREKKFFGIDCDEWKGEGVYKVKNGKYMSNFTFEGKKYYGGIFETKEEAAKVTLIHRQCIKSGQPFPKVKRVLPKGVIQYGNRFGARIRRNGVSHYLGQFGTKEEASKAYDLENNRLK